MATSWQWTTSLWASMRVRSPPFWATTEQERPPPCKITSLFYTRCRLLNARCLTDDFSHQVHSDWPVSSHIWDCLHHGQRHPVRSKHHPSEPGSVSSAQRPVQHVCSYSMHQTPIGFLSPNSMKYLVMFVLKLVVLAWTTG